MIQQSDPINHIEDIGERYLIGSSSSVFAISGVRLRVRPILATVGLAGVFLSPAAWVTGWFTHRMGMERRMSMPWLAPYVNHAVMLLIALLIIAWFSKGRFLEYGLQWPRSKTYVASAIASGIFFGILMTVVDHLPQIRARIPPPDNLALTTTSLIGWLSVMGFFVGFSEEIPFRGLLQTFLMRRSSGRVRLFKYEMHIAGVILALLFALVHITSFWQEPFWIALGQQAYAFALGILYAYWRDNSGSLLASIIGHNLSDGVEYALIFLMTWLWR